MDLDIATFNFELNGAGNMDTWTEAHELLKSLGLHLLLRQEVWDADAKGGTLVRDADRYLGLTSVVDPDTSTSVSYDPAVFEPVRTYNAYMFPGVIVALRLREAGPDSVPIVFSSAHFSYCSPTLRRIQAETATTLVDRVMTVGPRRTRVKLAALAGFDGNGYPVSGPGETELPTEESITDNVHWVHRSRELTPGVYGPDTFLDETLTRGRMVDVARYAAQQLGQPEALATTTFATTTHGEDQRVDRMVGSGPVVPAIKRVRVVPVRPDTSDHKIPLCTLDSQVLTTGLHEQLANAQARPLYAPASR